MRKLRNFAIFLLSFCVTLTLCACLFYKFMLTSVDKNNKKEVLFEIESGDTSRDIAKKLYDEKLIKNDKVFLVYLKLNGIKDIKAGYFNLNKSMDVKEIADELRKNTNINPNSVYILFKEGLNMRKIASIISESTDNSYDSVLEVLDNDEYIDSLIEKYWFLTNDIKNNNIYYALEGYLYPDTYRFESKDVKVEEIFEKMLDKEDEVLSKYKEQIDDESYSIHEVLTLASIAELEASDYEDKRNITGVFNNRLDKNMN